MSGHQHERCNPPRWRTLPFIRVLFEHSVWWCSCGKAHRLETGCAMAGGITYWTEVPELRWDHRGKVRTTEEKPRHIVGYYAPRIGMIKSFYETMEAVREQYPHEEIVEIWVDGTEKTYPAIPEHVI